MLFDLIPSYLDGGGRIRFLSCGGPVDSFGNVAADDLGHLYTVVFKYTNSHKTLNVTIKCIAE